MKTFPLAFFACLIFIFPVSPLSAAPQSLSFSQARNLVRERSDLLKAASANVESHKETVNSLKTLWGPTISAQAVELWGETHVDIDRSVKTPLGSMPIHINEDKNFSGPRASVTGAWPLFTGGKILAEQRASKYALEEAQAKEQSAAIEQDVKLIGLYFGLQLARSLENMRKSMYNEQKQELARAREFEKQGMISQVERMGVQVATDKSEREYLQARDNSRVARIQLARFMRAENFGELNTPLFVLTKGLSPMKEWVDWTIAHNPQIAQAEAQVMQAEQGVAAAKGSFSPDIFAFGQYSFIRHYQTMIEPTWIAGVGINLTLWDARGRLGKYRSARAVSREARSVRADVANQAATDAEVAWQNTMNALERYNLTGGNVKLARENLRLKTSGFEEGLNTALDMTDARTQLVEAQTARKVAAYEFVVNFAILHAIAGRMDDFLKTANRKDLIVEK